jgi:glycosyltransferase involved in cell wall biosynthesis
VSEQVAAVMAQRLRYPTGRITVVPRGRDPHSLGRRTPERRDAARVALGVADDDVVVLAVGRHEPPKALDVLVDAVSQVRTTCPHVRLFVAGREGSATDAVQRAIASRDAGGFVTLLGQRSDVPNLLCAADVFALPSRREGMPGAMIEAMALEVPIVASDLPQIREVVGADSALLAPVDRSQTFAEDILQCIEDPQTARDRVERAHARFLDNFTIEHTAQRMVAFYEQALAEPKAMAR